MPSPSDTLKKEHRRSGSSKSLKAFARDAQKNDKQLRDTVTAWETNKKGPPKKKKAAVKPKEVAPAAKAPTVKKR